MRAPIKIEEIADDDDASWEVLSAGRESRDEGAAGSSASSAETSKPVTPAMQPAPAAASPTEAGVSSPRPLPLDDPPLAAPPTPDEAQLVGGVPADDNAHTPRDEAAMDSSSSQRSSFETPWRPSPVRTSSRLQPDGGAEESHEQHQQQGDEILDMHALHDALEHSVAGSDDDDEDEYHSASGGDDDKPWQDEGSDDSANTDDDGEWVTCSAPAADVAQAAGEAAAAGKAAAGVGCSIAAAGADAVEADTAPRVTTAAAATATATHQQQQGARGDGASRSADGVGDGAEVQLGAGVESTTGKEAAAAASAAGNAGSSGFMAYEQRQEEVQRVLDMEGLEGEGGSGVGAVAAGNSGTAQQQEQGIEAAEAVVEEEEEEEPEEVKQAMLAEAEGLKQQGNEAYGAADYTRAEELYTRALDAAPRSAPQRAVYLCNRAAAALQRSNYSGAARDCSGAVEIDPAYTKAYLRRAKAYEGLGEAEKALADVQKVLELEPSNQVARSSVARLGPIVEEQREKLKEEMMGKLKELGNSILGNFGMSMDNFKAVQDPATGSYSISFQQ